MPILPLDHPDPFAATLGVMLYPGEDAASRQKARAFAAQLLAGPIELLEEADRASIDERQLYADATRVRLDDVQQCWWQGTATGQLFKIRFALYRKDPSRASWANATRIAARTAREHGVRGGDRSSLYAARRRYASVAHLWAAWCIREGQFRSDPSVGYEAGHDFEFFLAEAEWLREWGQSWRLARVDAEPPLPADAWRMPEGWRPPERRPGWPQSGGIPDLVPRADLLAQARKVGRPPQQAA